VRRAIIYVTAGLAAVAIGFGLNFATSRSTTEISVSNTTATPAISVWEIHNQAHLEFLPVQQFEDQSLVFAEKPR
jgi:type IV secretory pathway protease TraF